MLDRDTGQFQYKTIQAVFLLLQVQLSIVQFYQRPGQCKAQRVSATEWNDFFASRKWFPPHFMQTYYRYFRKNGVVLATYGYFSQSAPQKVGPETAIWFVNPIFPGKSLLPHSDGSIMENPLWFQDFVQAALSGRPKGTIH